MSVASLILAGSMAFGAAGDGAPHVSASGIEKVDVIPSVMRMTVKIEAKADTLDKALADLQAQWEQVKTKLAATNPTEGSLKMKGPALAGGSPDEQERTMRMMRRRFSNPGGAAKPDATKEAKKEVVLEAAVGAEWKLKSQDLPGLLRESEKLRESAQAAMPKPAAEKKEAPTEDEEERALMEQQAAMGQQMTKPGEPVFAFVGFLDKAQLAKARREAFAKARLEAQATAEAAGGKLGALTSLSALTNAMSGNEEYGGMNYYAMRAMQQSMGMFGGSFEEPESVSPALREVTFGVNVNASFVLEGAK